MLEPLQTSVFAELEAALHVSVQDPLLHLAGQRRITRQLVSGLFLYCSADPAVRQRQLQTRQADLSALSLSDSVVAAESVSDELKAGIILFYSLLDEKQRRLYAGLEALKLGRGGDRRISDLLGLDPHTVAKGAARTAPPGGAAGACAPSRRRAQADGKKTPEVITEIERLLEHDTAGDPMTGLRWMRRTTTNVATQLSRLGIQGSARTVARLLRKLHFSLRVNSKKLGARHPDRDRQFRYIAKLRQRFRRQGNPIISVDAKKREMVGNFKNADAKWDRVPTPVNDHDFRSLAEGIAILYGIYDPQANRGSMFVGVSHETSAFAVASIRRWWGQEGRRRYPNARRLLILADTGGSNPAARGAWKDRLQQELCDRFGLTVTVAHYPTGASKYNPIERRLFSQISNNWAGEPLGSYQKILNFIRLRSHWAMRRTILTIPAPKPVPALHTCSPRHSLLGKPTSARIMAYHLGDPSAPSAIVSREPKSFAESRGILSMRRFRLAAVPACLLVASISLLAQAQQTPQQPPQQQTPPPPQQPKPPVNPFETAPRVQQTPQLEAPKAAEAAPQLRPGQLFVDSVAIHGLRRVPQETLMATMVTKAGDIYDEELLRRDFMALWNTNRFDDIRLETEPGERPNSVKITFVVTERRVIRTIHYQGIHTVTESEILDRFKERKVGLVVESQYDANKIQHAANVLKEFLSERGRQYATVDPQIEQIPPSSLALTFNVNEGPKVKVGTIVITGNHAYSQRWVIDAMKNLHPYGIPHSIVAENLFAKTYDAAKLEEDGERIRQAYSDHGYFKMKALEPTVTIIPRGGKGWRLPIIKMEQPGIYADIVQPVDEERLYHLHTMKFEGVKLFRTPEALMRPLFGMGPGDVFQTDKLRKGIENIRNLYGKFGYIDFVPEPDFNFIPNTDQVDLTITADEGKQFFVRRIDFSGNSTTRDKVIRREIMLDEGDMFNSSLWDLSILRLNQLGYFEVLKKDEAADIHKNIGSNTVDITLKVRERGKNSIGLNGGVSGIAGSFVGFNYSTNNFLGLGETLSLNSQLGTIMRSASLSFTEPYLLDKPIQTGFTIYLNRYDFNQARQASIFAGQNLAALYNSLGAQNLLNYVQNSHGFKLFASYQLRRSFWRTGITYGYDISNIVTQTTAATNYFQYLDFSGVYGPNSLDGIHTSSITPSLTYNTVNHPINPSSGKSIYFSLGFAGSVLGGNVNTITPAVDLKYFHPSPIRKSQILAFHFLTSIITSYGGKEVPPFSRSFMGGENDVRGFDFYSITPIAYIASSASINVLNSDGSARTQQTVSGGSLTPQPVTMQIPTYQIITPGGDWHSVFNFEYRIPIVGPITLAPFFDAGLNRILRPDQLTMDPARVEDLNLQFPQAGFSGKVQIAPGTQKPVASTGLEIQVILPVVNAPFRVYFAYNPSTIRENLQPPIVADRAAFPNQATFNNAVASFGQIFPFDDRRTYFHFTVGRTF